jgi:Transposase domain (DUF772)
MPKSKSAYPESPGGRRSWFVRAARSRMSARAWACRSRRCCARRLLKKSRVCPGRLRGFGHARDAVCQVGMFDAAVLARPLPGGSFYALLAEHGDRIARDEDFAECYSQTRGRPSIPPSQLARVMLLQHRTGLSDEAAMEAVKWDLRWKVALGLPIDHDGWHPAGEVPRALVVAR